MTYLPWLEDLNGFPDPETAFDEPDGLLAAGGDLAPERLIEAYRNGIFPWFSDDQPILWWSPDPRCIVYPRNIHISRSLRKHIRKSAWQLSFNRCFSRVIRCCAQRGPSEGTWITPTMIQAYEQLHQRGIAHSIEVWDQDELVGGLYGLAIGRCFFGESMFSIKSNGSKIALTALCQQLARWDYAIVDCQVENPHLLSLGAELIPRRLFLSILRNNVVSPPSPHQWAFDPDIPVCENPY